MFNKLMHRSIFGLLPLLAVVACVETREAAPTPALVERPAWTVASNYDKRSGNAQALADLAGGKPTKLYWYAFEGEAPHYLTPGLLNCDPDLDTVYSGTNALFASLPDGDFSEGQVYSEFQRNRAVAARGFARSYNRTMFRERSAEIISVCPEVKLDAASE